MATSIEHGLVTSSSPMDSWSKEAPSVQERLLRKAEQERKDKDRRLHDEVKRQDELAKKRANETKSQQT